MHSSDLTKCLFQNSVNFLPPNQALFPLHMVALGPPTPLPTPPKRNSSWTSEYDFIWHKGLACVTEV